MAKLSDVFTPLIAYMLYFTQLASEQRRDFAALRGRIGHLMEEQRAAVKRGDIDPHGYENACFAIVAWIDETVMSRAHDQNVELFNQWRRSPLQAELFNTANAGEEFFDRLGRLAPTDKEIIEVYWLALCLGFRGRYYDESQSPRLAELRRQYAAYLPAPAIDLLDFEKRRERVTPPPYAAAAPEVKPPPRRLSPYWLAAPFAAAAAALLIYFLWPTGPDPEAIRDALRDFDCADVNVAGIDHGMVRLAGRVESDEQSERMRRRVAQIPGVTGVGGVLDVVPRPFCQVLDILASLTHGAQNGGSGLAISPSKGCGATYYRGENMVVDVTDKKPLHYVYVDYYVADGRTVAHLLPNPRQPDNSLGNAIELTIGGASDKAQWQIQPPFGREMVTVISSPKPLFSPPREMPESDDTYLASLGQALKADAPADDIAAAYCFTESADR
jgi:type IV/VI secretion system ImpK/VasF family protein